MATAPHTELLRTRIRAAGLRGTTARLQVLRALHGASGPRTHSEVFDAVVDEGLDRATVYRNLMALADAGIVSRTDLGDHVWRFELLAENANPADRHPHFVCTDCGVVSCLPEVSLTFAAVGGAAPTRPGKVSEILLKGVCDKCDDPPPSP